MKTHTPVKAAAGLGLIVLTLLMSSCAGPKYTAMDHRDYTKMPACTSSKVWRGIAKSNPWTAKAAFHGRWGGSGNEGGEPVDVLDEGFRRHDIVYYESRCGEHLKAADRELVEWLENLDEDTLDDRQLKYRKRAIKFMTSPLANVVGKPPAVMMKHKERDGCYFTSAEVVKAFFEPSDPGFPYASPAPDPAVAAVPESVEGGVSTALLAGGG
jgi:hypothetical protein